MTRSAQDATDPSVTADSATADSQSPDTKPKKDLSILLDLWPFLKPYGWNLVGAAVALVFTAATTLVLGQGVKLLIDEGFVGASTAQLNQAVMFIFTITALMAIGTFARFYLVSWLGERVTADIRTKVFDHLVHLHRARI